MLGTVAMQAGLGLQIAVLISRIRSTLDLASTVTATGAGISGSVTAPAAGACARAGIAGNAPIAVKIMERSTWSFFTSILPKLRPTDVGFAVQLRHMPLPSGFLRQRK